jgi:hypothetical protein
MDILADLLPEAEVARQLHVTRRTLQIWRSRRTGPAPTIVGRSVYYARASIAAWLASLERPNPRKGSGR